MSGLVLVAAVAVASAAGAHLRWALDRWVQQRAGTALPWGTLTVNVAGSFLLGAFTGLAGRGLVGGGVEVVLGVGLCGSLTTFSTWTYETVRLAEDGAWWEAWVNVGLSLVAGLGAAALGWLAVAGAAALLS